MASWLSRVISSTKYEQTRRAVVEVMPLPPALEPILVPPSHPSSSHCPPTLRQLEDVLLAVDDLERPLWGDGRDVT